MRPTFITVLICFVHIMTFAQTDSKTVIEELCKLQDQNSNSLDKQKAQGSLTVIYVPGPDNPFEKVLDRFKGRKLKSPQTVQVVVGLKEQMTGISNDAKRDHLQGGINSGYGKDSFSILLDLDSKLTERLSIKGWSIIILEKDKKAQVKDFGTDRKKFLDEINQYFN